MFYLFIGLVTTFWLESTRSQRMRIIVSVDISFVSLISEGVFLLPFVREKRGAAVGWESHVAREQTRFVT